MMWAVVIERDPIFRWKYKPRLLEVTRLRPKTMFYRAGPWGEGRLMLKDIRYQTFDDKTQAERFCDELCRTIGVYDVEHAQKAAAEAIKRARIKAQHIAESWTETEDQA